VDDIPILFKGWESILLAMLSALYFFPFASHYVLMSQKQATHICYYSNRCKSSKAFIQELAQTRWKNDFRFLCVDPSPNRPKLPDWLKKTPTLVIAGEPEARVDGEVMNWLYENKLRDASSSATNAVQPDGTPGGEPMGWNTMEHVSFGKGFGYSFNTDDTSTQGTGGLSIPGAFGFLHGAAAAGDRNSQDFPGSTNQTARNRSKKEEIFDKQMEAYQRSREDGIPKAAPRQ
jgi:hypothetical protein